MLILIGPACRNFAGCQQRASKRREEMIKLFGEPVAFDAGAYVACFRDPAIVAIFLCLACRRHRDPPAIPMCSPLTPGPQTLVCWDWVPAKRGAGGTNGDVFRSAVTRRRLNTPETASTPRALPRDAGWRPWGLIPICKDLGWQSDTLRRAPSWWPGNLQWFHSVLIRSAVSCLKPRWHYCSDQARRSLSIIAAGISNAC